VDLEGFCGEVEIEGARHASPGSAKGGRPSRCRGAFSTSMPSGASAKGIRVTSGEALGTTSKYTASLPCAASLQQPGDHDLWTRDFWGDQTIFWGR
jgi:hypothetical protein